MTNSFKLSSTEISPKPYTVNDKIDITKFGFPSNKSEEVKIGASLTYYKAPADGYFVVYLYNSNTGCFVNLIGSVNVRINTMAGWASAGYIPIKKDKSMLLEYQGTITSFYFVYAQSQS